ncbi:alpha-glucosidase [Dysgonomonas hofstadii]|uniref:Alpha-glucosidase n=1 Tax=Dysgonomonas hofstadii TaxID=637886 RepID=A0A840CYW1_9BACT|nr:glycoside hydrolase family 31 protein [Dysgonomonas hofstadii]MBB4037133.1 alpha-glucosidase [Dysgonomonas hofstadii]
MKKVILNLIGLICTISFIAQETREIDLLPGEKWWGGATGIGYMMPFENNTNKVDLRTQDFNNQTSPLLVSNKGRYIWSDSPFTFQFKNEKIVLSSQKGAIDCVEAGKTLKDAYLGASQKHFPPSGVLPPDLFFSKPQYNTWIELIYNQNQEDVLKYAKDLIDNGFPPGVLMIDDNWQKYYGNFEFRPDKFPDPKAMVDQLHAMGFKVMLWVSPFVSPDTQEYRYLRNQGYLVKDRNKDRPAILDWWNGLSACYDLSNPDAYNHLLKTLQNMQSDYGIDGFKFDAGDQERYLEEDIRVYDNKSFDTEQTYLWAKLGLEFPYNEYRACWKLGGEALVQRLGDKQYSWRDVAKLVPDMVATGLVGYAYACPDMIGGGEYSSFQGVDPAKFDQRLIVRSCQIHSMMPMMQFSVAPWRILDKSHLDICLKYAKWHEELGDYILSLAQHSSKTGEPIARHMEYMFPDEGFEDCKDQYMLGDKYLVAPIMSENDTRTVKLPKGNWTDDLGQKYKGGKVYTITVPIDRLLWFEKSK